ncbi:radical SAM/SPASM domain-containing protein [Lachnoclostridium sp.]|uniref:radical SAM/SPASM domain-containing protein n=2 Tax=Lachnoclostridium sp. TaxID=2028282 RepID=UPI0028A0F7A1|nr:radical SAM/SPASM domain-containing protein [Lachnoclostridium sp.]
MNSLQKSKKPRFKKVYIEITNVCNLQCDFCPKTKRTPKFLTIPEFEHIIEEVSPYTNYIYLHIMGEPLLHENLKEFIEIAGKKNIKVNLTTNGTLLSPEKEFLLNLSALRQINISLHSFEANERNLTLHDYVRSVMSFVKKASMQSGLLCSVRLWNMDFGDLKGANSLNREIIQLIESELEIKESLEEKLCKEHSCKVSHNVYFNMAQKFEWPDMKRDMFQNEVFCYGLRDQIGILVDGTVVPCCLDSEGTINLGNLYKQNLETILSSERAKTVYDGFSRRVAVEELCKRCGYATRF